ARLIAQGLTEKFGQRLIGDNRAGAGGNIGTDQIANAAPDVYTIGLATAGPLVNNKILYKTIPFDSDKDLAPIALVCEIPLVIASNPEVPVKYLKELLQQAKAQPQAYTVGQPGNGTIGHLAMEQLSMVSKVKLTTV